MKKIKEDRELAERRIIDFINSAIIRLGEIKKAVEKQDVKPECYPLIDLLSVVRNIDSHLDTVNTAVQGGE